MPGLFNVIGNILDNILDCLATIIGAILATAIYAVGAVLSLAVDLVDWITGNQEEIVQQGGTEVNVIMGSALSDFIRDNQTAGKYTEVTFDQLKSMDKGIVNVASKQNGDAVKVQMITSKDGLSAESVEAFKGNSVMKVKLS
jgi:hypothetical protein